MGRTMFEVRCSKPKIGCSSSFTNRWTCSSSFDVRKSDVRFYSMDNLVKAFWVRCSILVHSKLKFWHLSSIINRWTCSSSFDVRKNGVPPIFMNSSKQSMKLFTWCFPNVILKQYVFNHKFFTAQTSTGKGFCYRFPSLRQRSLWSH